jgi:hypothetical protein
MAKAKGEFQRFIPLLLRRLQAQWPFLRPFDASFCVAIPRSRSLYCGVSPRYGKHVIVDFQHSAKAWNVGQFTINVHISEELAPTGNWTALSRTFATFEDGFYRLPDCVEDRERWWCLRADEGNAWTGRRKDDRTLQYWEPDSYADPQQVFAQAADDVARYLETHLFRKAGFVV